MNLHNKTAVAICITKPPWQIPRRFYIENYRNSGRTAVIFHLNAENLKKSLDVHTTYTDIYFGVTIDQDAHPGKVRNYVYAVGDNLEEYQNQTGGTEDIYDLNNNGRTDDMIAYGYSDATIIAAQSIYAEKFIAPDGSNNSSKQGLLVKTGTNFDYLLKITNETKEKYSGLVVYDTLPHSGDKNVFGTQDRSSEFDIHLRGVITPPKGYSVYYTTSTDVYQKSMADMVNADIWMDSVSDYSAVTAFKIVANEGTALNGESTFEVRIPAQAGRADIRLRIDCSRTTNLACAPFPYGLPCCSALRGAYP